MALAIRRNMVANRVAQKDVIVPAAACHLATSAPGQEPGIAPITRGHPLRAIGLWGHRFKMARRPYGLPNDRHQDLVGIRVKDGMRLCRLVLRWHEPALLICAHPANRQPRTHHLVFSVALRPAPAPRPDQLSPCQGISQLSRIA